MNRRDNQFLDEIVTILRKIYGDNWDYDFDVEEDGIYLRLNVWGEPDERCNTCGDTLRWQTTTEDSPTTLVDLGPCPDCCEVTA